jgi:hypothetical protein
MCRKIYTSCYSVHVQKDLHKLLQAHLLAPTGQRHSVHKNEWEDHGWFFVQYIATNIIVKVVKYNFYVSLLDIRYHFLVANIANNIYSMLACILICMKYISLIR